MKKKIVITIIILAVVGTLVALPNYLRNKRIDELILISQRERCFDILGSKRNILVEGKPLLEVLEDDAEKNIFLNDHFTITILEENFDDIYFSIFVWRMEGIREPIKEWNYEEVRESLEKEIAMLADKEHGIAVLYDKETQLGGYKYWVINEGADERVLIKEVEEAIIDLGNGKNADKAQGRADELGVSLPEFYEITGNYIDYPEHWEALYRLAEQEAEE